MTLEPAEGRMRDRDVTPVLEVEDLRVQFPHEDQDSSHGSLGGLRAVTGVTFTLRSGKTLGLIGESGCGKTATAHAILGLVPSPGRVHARRITLHHEGADGHTTTDLARLDPRGERMREVRGGQVAMVFQDAAASLSPVRTIGAQLRETIQLHRSVGRSTAERLSVELLDRVGLSDSRMNEYAHQLSGGISQRVAIALALGGGPRVLIADEPTTALDRVVQEQVVALIRQLQSDLGMAVLYITHDLGLVEDACDDVAVMYLGRIVEQAPAQALLTQPLHPYTRRLLESAPRLGRRRGRLPTIPGVVPIPIGVEAACAFAPRCDEVFPPCRGAVPSLVEVATDHHVRCYLHSPEQEAGQDH